MSDKRITAPDLTTPLKGPASYFPSIEKTYGQPMQYWLDLVAIEIISGKKHMEVVAMLKTDYGIGHGHANAVVAYVLARI